jgi:glutamate dehydrogenase/leucine dehydrogenase
MSSTPLQPSVYQTVTQQFNTAANRMGFDREIRKILSKIANEIIVKFPVKMDDGHVEMFTGYRVQHNNALGPYKDGLRYHPAVNSDEVRALVTRMTCTDWRTAAYIVALRRLELVYKERGIFP